MSRHDPWATIRDEIATPAPVQTLRDLGLTGGTPAWWRDEGKVTEPGEHVLFPVFLSPSDLQQLAALTLEGYQVKTFPRGNRIKVHVSKEPTDD